MPGLGGQNQMQELAAMTKGIGTRNNMLVMHLKNRAIMGHYYPVASIDFHEYAMTCMMV